MAAAERRRQGGPERGVAGPEVRRREPRQAPAARGHGLGGKLLERLMGEVGPQVELEAWSHADHPAARRLATVAHSSTLFFLSRSYPGTAVHRRPD